LRGDLLGGPAVVVLQGISSLTLDPKEKVFHSAGSLKVLAPYCVQPLPHAAWRPITSAELGRLRISQPAQPYSRLIWLDTFVHFLRIATAMQQPAKLNEIAASSDAPMDEVFAFVSAYDAIGLIEVERRPPRHFTPAPAGLLGLLRNPFGKR
jgi:hypothetical protein